MPTAILEYTPPKTINKFIKHYRPGELFEDWIVGPVGSGKTTGIFFKLVFMAMQQAKASDGIRYSRAVIVRNTMPMLKDTTLVSWAYWFKQGQAGHWNATDKIFTLKFSDVECEVLFRPLDTPDDVDRVLSLEVSFILIDEFVEIHQKIIEALSARAGRYRGPDGTPSTNWGMWGSSNPSTEDNWWFDYLHQPEMVLAMNGRQYYLQPSALSPDAENVINLPGKEKYYTNVMRGKSKVWNKQYVEAEWGFSIAGTPVISQFRDYLHVSKRPLLYNKWRTLVIGVDPGFAGSAMILGQQDEDGIVYILDELVQVGMSGEEMVSRRLKPLLRERFPNARVRIIPDPASNIRAQSDAKTVTAVFVKHFGREAVDTRDLNNRLARRVDSINYFLNRNVDGVSCFQVDPRCKVFIRALKGGWRFAMDTKRDEIKGVDPEKNQWSHPGDAGGYLCSYFMRASGDQLQYSAARAIGQRRTHGGSYHIR